MTYDQSDLSGTNVGLFHDCVLDIVCTVGSTDVSILQLDVDELCCSISIVLILFGVVVGLNEHLGNRNGLLSNRVVFCFTVQ